jgi:transposase
MFNLAIDSKLRGCDVVAIRVEDVAASGYTADRATVRQKKTGRPVRFEMSEQTRQAIDDYLKAANKRPGEFLFTGRRGPETSMTTRQYARLVSDWIGSVGLDPRLFGTHSVLLSALLPQTMLLADRGYDADWIRELARQQGAWANIRPKRNRKDPICFSPYLYRARNLIERFFNKIKQCRRVATRYDKLAANYLAFVKLASIRIWLRAK